MGHASRWAGSYQVTRSAKKRRVGSTGHCEDNAGEHVSPAYWARPTQISCCLGEVFGGLPSYVAFQAPHDLGGVESSFSSACHIGTGLLMAGNAGEHDAKEGGVGVAVASIGVVDCQLGDSLWLGSFQKAL